MKTKIHLILLSLFTLGAGTNLAYSQLPDAAAPDTIYQIDKVTYTLLNTASPGLLIDVKGKVSSGGWKSPQLVPRFSLTKLPRNGIYEFDFIATPPSLFAAQVLTDIKAKYVFKPIPSGIKKIIVYGKSNHKEFTYP